MIAPVTVADPIDGNRDEDLCAATVQQPGRKMAAFSVKATYAYVAN
jgi:hypothetical protein